MPNTLKAAQSNVIQGLGTWTHIVAQTQMYYVSVDCSEIPPSGITITIQKNGSQVAASSVPASAQSNVKISQIINCTAADVLSVVIASSSQSDAAPNVTKSIIVVRQGQ